MHQKLLLINIVLILLPLSNRNNRNSQLGLDSILKWIDMYTHDPYKGFMFWLRQNLVLQSNITSLWIIKTKHYVFTFIIYIKSIINALKLIYRYME